MSVLYECIKLLLLLNAIFLSNVTLFLIFFFYKSYSINTSLTTGQSELHNDEDKTTQEPLKNDEKFDTLLKNIAKESSLINSGGIETDNNMIVKIDVNDAISINNDVNLQKLDYYEKPNNLSQTANNNVNMKLKCNIFNGMLQI